MWQFQSRKGPKRQVQTEGRGCCGPERTRRDRAHAGLCRAISKSNSNFYIFPKTFSLSFQFFFPRKFLVKLFFFLKLLANWCWSSWHFTRICIENLARCHDNITISVCMWTIMDVDSIFPFGRSREPFVPPKSDRQVADSKNIRSLLLITGAMWFGENFLKYLLTAHAHIMNN